MSTDQVTTLAGGSAGVAIISTVDFAKLGNLDRGEIAKVVFGLALGVLGYFTNKDKTSNGN